MTGHAWHENTTTIKGEKLISSVEGNSVTFSKTVEVGVGVRAGTDLEAGVRAWRLLKTIMCT